MCGSVSDLQRLCGALPGYSYFRSLMLLGTLHQPKVLVFDVLGTRLKNQLSLWCVYEQLVQILLSLPLSLIVFDIFNMT